MHVFIIIRNLDITMPLIEYAVQAVPFHSEPNPLNDDFINLYNYFALNPEGIAEWLNIYAGSNSLLFSNKCVKSYLFKINEGKKIFINKRIHI